MRGALLDFATLDRGDISLDCLSGTLDELAAYDMSRGSEIAARLADAEVAITNKIRFDAILIESLPQLRLICIAATGTDIIDLEAARQRGVAVANVRGYCTAAVAQHVFALVLALTQRLNEYRALTAGGGWQRSRQFNLLDFPLRELAGKNFTVIGYGALGRAAARIAEAFGMRIVVAERRGRSPRPGRVAFEEALRLGDVVSLHCPMTPGTRDLISSPQLSLMKPDALLINTARGGLVDSAALLAALQDERLGGAGIDVLPVEPPGDDEPLLSVERPNLIVTPHIAWAAREARQRAIDEIALNILAYRNGEERNRVV